MPRGGPRAGSGRKKGSPNKHKSSFRTSIREYCDSIGVDPHHYMADIIADESEIVYGVDSSGAPIVGPAAKPELKLNAARELAQYLEPKLKAMDIEVSGNPDKPLTLSIRRAK